MYRCLLPLVCLLAFSVPDEARAVEIGQSVLAYWEADQAYFLATVVEKTDTGYLVVFEDGDRADLPAGKIYANNIAVGTAVIAKWDDGNFYPGKVAKIVGRAYFINYDDGDQGWAPASWIVVKNPTARGEVK